MHNIHKSEKSASDRKHCEWGNKWRDHHRKGEKNTGGDNRSYMKLGHQVKRVIEI